ncbi:MAG: hypothetical protein ACREAM_03305 [Blastocatellia bacterium]
MDVTRSFASRRIPPNTAEPGPLLLHEAFGHLFRGRLLGFGVKPWPLAATIFILIIGLLASPSFALALLSGVALAILALALFYLCWYGRFVRLNDERGVLCPRCTSRMWQLRCRSCSEPAPPLALMLWGAFLATCLHCHRRLSCRDETLQAWCSTCNHAEPRPDLLYRKPMRVLVWVVDGLPDPNKIGDGWRVTSDSHPSRMTLFHRGEPHSTCLLLLVDYKEEGELLFGKHIIERSRGLVVSDTIPGAYVERFKNPFSKNLLKV